MKKQRTLPRPPTAVAEVIRTASDPEAGTADLADIIAKDPVLSAEILRSVNSSYYSLPNKVSSVSNAVAYMGVRAARNLVLCLGIKEAIPATGATQDYPLQAFWEGCIRRASSARCIASVLEFPKSELDEMFTLGLCQDLGILVELNDVPGIAGELGAAINQPFWERLAVEHGFGASHDEVGADLLTSWNLPDAITVPVKFHHWPDGADELHRKRAWVAHVAESVSDLFTVTDKRGVLLRVRDQFESIGLDPAMLDSLVAEVNAQTELAAKMLGLRVKVSPSYAEIVGMASQGLEELNASYEDLTRQLQKTVREKDRLAEELVATNRKLYLSATRDPLTKLANRRAFTDAMETSIAQADRQGEPLSVLMIDLDHFKNVNDSYGHPAGDRVLVQLAKVLCGAIRQSDVAARIGGEEFAVILPFTAPAGARIVADRILKGVSDLAIPAKGVQIRVTVSIGGATVENPKTDPQGKQIMEAADRVLYEAKHSGRNRIVWADTPSKP